MNITEIVESRQGENYTLHRQHVNPTLARVLQMIGYDTIYAKGEGCYLYDVHGEQYLDFLGGYGVFHLGRNHPHVRRVIHETLDLCTANMVQMDCPLLSGLLAEALVEHVPWGLDAVFFTNSGTESVEAALKFARAATGRPRTLYLDHAFHGLTLGSLSVNGNENFREGFGELLPGCESIPLNDLDRLEQELAHADVAGFIVEPLQGKGVYVPDDLFLSEAQRLCREHGTIFICDEVQTGLGRTGKWFAGQHWELEPDILLLSKSLSGGLVPVGALLTTRDIYDKVFSRLDRCVVHSSTFKENDLAMAAGLATLEILDRDGLIENSAHMGEKLLRGLEELQKRYDLVKEVRGKGLMIGIEFGEPRSIGLKMGWKMAETAQAGLFAQMVTMSLMRKHRVLTQVSGHQVNIIKLLPPLIVTEAEIDYFITALDDALAEAHRFPGGLWEMGTSLVREAVRGG